MQIEYALQAVAAGAPSMGIKAKKGVVLAVEKKQKSFLYDESSITKASVGLGKGLTLMCSMIPYQKITHEYTCKGFLFFSRLN